LLKVIIYYLERGRPPKGFNTDVVDPIENLDSPPKAKRKSRPPRRHKPFFDSRDDSTLDNMNEGGHGPSTMVGSSLLDFSGNYLLSSLENL